MVLSEKDFLLELESDKLTLKSLFSKASQYDCPCRRKNMTNADWQQYKNGYMQKVWKLLHERSFKYLNKPSSDAQEKVFNFYNNDVKAIPCYVCRKHYTEFISKNNLKDACTSREKLCKFLIDLHNDVNKDTKKPIMSYQDVYKLYGYHYSIFNYPVVNNLSNRSLVFGNQPIKSEPIKLNPMKSEPIKSEPIKLNPLKSEPVKLNSIKSQSDKSNNDINNLIELNKLLLSKQIFSNNRNYVNINRNNIVKSGMMRAINRGRETNK